MDRPKLRLPIGQSDFRVLREQGYTYVDKTAFVIEVIDSNAQADREFRPYWIATSSNDLVRELLSTGPHGLRTELEELLRGGTVDKPIEEHVVSRQVGGSSEVQALLQALLRGDARTVEHYLSRMLETSLSYHDTGGPEPERVIHGFIIGLLVGLGPDHEVRSNRESGYGRYDVMVLPRTPGRPGVVLELKTVDTEAGETPSAALEGAPRQLRDRDYATELRERGASPIIELAAVFDGKRAWVTRAAD